jgi:hypothetical protein
LEVHQLRSQQVTDLPAPFETALILIADQFADLVQRQADRLRLLDESQTIERLRRVHAEAAARSLRCLQEP